MTPISSLRAHLAAGQLLLSWPACSIAVPFHPADVSSAQPAKLELITGKSPTLLCAFRGTYSATGLSIEPEQAAQHLTGVFWLRLSLRVTKRGQRLQLLSNFVPDSPLVRIHGFERIRAAMAAELRAQLSPERNRAPVTHLAPE